jgi:hypothetical protein
LLGVLGMFVAVPVAGVLRVALLHALPRARAPQVAVVSAEAPSDVPPAVAVSAPAAPKKARGARA